MRRRDEVLVGALLLVATVIAVLGTLWLARGGLQSGYPLYARFEWGQNMRQGQPLLLAGVTVGYVDHIELREGGYLDVMVRVNDEYRIPLGSTAKVQPVGIFGDVAVALTPPKVLSGRFYQAGDTLLPGPPTPDIAQILGRVDSIGTSVQRLASSIQTEMVDAGGIRDMRATIASANSLTQRLNAVVMEQNRNLTMTLASVRQATNAVDSAQIAGAVENIRETTANTARLTKELEQSSAQLTAMLTRLNQGEGTAGKLLSDTLLYRDLRALVTRVDSLTIDFKSNPRKYINLEIF
jgi:phospholipid/cholesterol/gamma-HCH transport system substrate-binding protein